MNFFFTETELRKKCTEHGIKYVPVLKKAEWINEFEKYYKSILQSFMIKSKYKTKKHKEETRLIVYKHPILVTTKWNATETWFSRSNTNKS